MSQCTGTSLKIAAKQFYTLESVVSCWVDANCGIPNLGKNILNNARKEFHIEKKLQYSY